MSLIGRKARNGNTRRRQAAEVWITGEVLECNPPKLLVLSWADPDNLADKSRVTFEIEAIEDMTCLKVTHDNLEGGFEDAPRRFPGVGRVFFPA